MLLVASCGREDWTPPLPKGLSSISPPKCLFIVGDLGPIYNRPTSFLGPTSPHSKRQHNRFPSHFQGLQLYQTDKHAYAPRKATVLRCVVVDADAESDKVACLNRDGRSDGWENDRRHDGRLVQACQKAKRARSRRVGSHLPVSSLSSFRLFAVNLIPICYSAYSTLSEGPVSKFSFYPNPKVLTQVVTMVSM